MHVVFVCITRLTFFHALSSFLVNAVILDMSYNITDVRDVALAQIVAMEHDSVLGRHCFANEAVHLSTVLQIIHEAFHDMELPTRKVS